MWPKSWTVGCVVVGVLAGVSSGEVAWRSETAGDPAAVAAIVEAQRLGARVAPDRGAVEAELTRLASELEGARRMVVSFAGALSEEERAALGERGVRVMEWLGGGSYFATIDPGALDAPGASAIGSMRSVEAIRPEWKLHPALIGGAIPSWAVLGEGEDPTVAAYVVFHPDVAPEEAWAVAAVHGGVVRDEVETVRALVVELPERALPGLAAEDAVQWVEPPLPRMSELNAENRALTQAEEVQLPAYGLDGSGVVVMVYDGGTARTTHTDFSGRASIRDGSGQSDHATHVAGTIGGDGTSNFANRGMAPGVTIESYGFQYDGSGTFLYTNPGDIESDYQSGYLTFGAKVTNNSIGTNTETNGFDCALQGDYGVTSALLDEIVAGSLGVPVRVVWAAGNERQGSRCDVEGYGDYYSSAPPSLAKNTIGVGAINSNNESMTSFSSWGPADDGRTKPDVTAPGCQSDGDLGVTSLSSSGDTSYSVKCGTSMAAPTVTGLVALLLEDFAAQFPARPLPLNSTVKALLIQGAVDLGLPGPDYTYGYGSVRIKDTIDFMRTDNFLEDDVTLGEAYTVLVTVGAGEPELRITLAWDDAAGTPNVSPALVNDLDLVVLDPNGVRHHPWTLDPLTPSAPAVRTGEDHLNNVEQVLVETPMAGTWTVEVRGTAVPEGPQPFSLASSAPPMVTGIDMALVGGAPQYIDPGVPLDLTVSVEAVGQNMLGTPQVFWRYDGGAFQSQALTPAGGTEYGASLPAPSCGDTVEVYFSAEGDQTGVHLLPANAPTGVFSPTVGEKVTPLAYDFEVSVGWVVDPDGTDTATTGIWTRMDPEQTEAQPEDDVTPDPGVNCWVTDGLAGSSLGANDVDGGHTTLASAPIDLSALDNARMGYWRWYSNTTGAAPNADVFVIDISDDGGSTWVNVETIGPSGAGTSGGWFYHEFDVEAFVSLTNQVRLRFIAEDIGTGSLVEAAVDEIRVTSEQCVPPPPPGCAGDLDGDNDVDIFDFGIFAPNFGLGPGATEADGDLDGNGFVDVFDFGIFANNFGTVCP